MKICMVSYSVYDADGRVMRYAEALAQRGDQVDVVALSAGDRPAHETVNGVNVFRIQSRTRKERSKFSYLFRILIFFFRSMLFLSRRELKVRYDVLHIHSVPDFLVYTGWLPKLRKARIILDIHDVLPELYASKFGCSEQSATYKVLLAIERCSASFADQVIVANHLWADKLIARGLPAEKCTTVLNYPDRRIFVRRGRTRDAGKIVMIYPGSLNWHQGVDIAIRAFASIKDLSPNSEFHIHGGGPAREELQRLASELGVQTRVKFHESRDISEVAGLIENADFGVVPKRNDPFGDEAFSTKILEFMTMGVPVVVSGTKIDRYYFNDSIVKFFVPGDEKNLAAAMLELITHPAKRAELARNALEFVQDYDWDRNKHSYLNIVDGLARLSARTSGLSRSTVSSGEQFHAGESLYQYFRSPKEYLKFEVPDGLSSANGFFRFGKETTCYGKLSNGKSAPRLETHLFDALGESHTDGDTVHLPFDIDLAVKALRYEQYPIHRGNSVPDSIASNIYYLLRPLFPVSVRKHFQKIWLAGWEKISFPSWPVDTNADNLMRQALALTMRAHGIKRMPFIWFWPDSASSGAIMSHDVETVEGKDFCENLMNINDSYGMKASFQIVPETRYEVPEDFLSMIRDRGFEVNVQDLNHDGLLYKNAREFNERATKINAYGEKWGSRGFRAAILYRNQSWFDKLKFEYDMSVPNVAHLDPQRGGCCTVMPYFIGDMLELPVTTTQDYTLFNILNDYSLDLWKRQADLIMSKNGLISFIVHPDYIVAEPARKVYQDLLEYLATLRDQRNVWMATPGEVNYWWRQRAHMELVRQHGEWTIVGDGHERATVAYAREQDGKLVFSFDPGSEDTQSEFIANYSHQRSASQHG